MFDVDGVGEVGHQRYRSCVVLVTQDKPKRTIHDRDFMSFDSSKIPGVMTKWKRVPSVGT